MRMERVRRVRAEARAIPAMAPAVMVCGFGVVEGVVLLLLLLGAEVDGWGVWSMVTMFGEVFMGNKA